MKNVFIIDDDDEFVELVRFRLNLLGHNLKSSKEVAQFANEGFFNNVDLVFLDLFFDEKLSGIKILSFLREKFNLKAPVVVLSASEDVDHILNCMELGAISYLRKPITKNQFDDFINSIFLSENDKSGSVFQFSRIQEDFSELSLILNIEIDEVYSRGFVLQSEQLIKRNCQVRVKGDLVKEIFLKDSILMTVIKNELHQNGKFKTWCEIDYLSNVDVGNLSDWVRQRS